MCPHRTCLLLATLVFVQAPEALSVGTPAGIIEDATSIPVLAEVEAALSALEADAGIADAVNDLLRKKYTDAIEAPKKAAECDAKARECPSTVYPSMLDLLKPLANFKHGLQAKFKHRLRSSVEPWYRGAAPGLHQLLRRVGGRQLAAPLHHLFRGTEGVVAHLDSAQ